MVSTGWVVSRAFGAETLTCSHCGSAALYPYPGLLGELGAVLHRVRYACRDCRRTSWLRPDADAPQAPLDEPELEVPGPREEPAALDALDVDMAPPPPAATDLTALDEQLAHQRRRRKRR
jgi:hypothetical protein